MILRKALLVQKGVEDHLQLDSILLSSETGSTVFWSEKRM